jgi:diguanylate cyclase (GGDEF)-like protein
VERASSLIARSAALLAAGYPIAVLMERLCDAIADAFSAEVFVALSAQNELTIVYASNRGSKGAIDQARVSDAAHEAFASREAVVRHDEQLAQLYVPIVRESDTLGVLGIRRSRARAFDQTEVRLFEALARYVELGLRNRDAERAHELPWSGAPLLVTLASVITLVLGFGIFAYAASTAAGVRETAAKLQEARLQQAALGLQDYLGDSSHVAESMANVIGPVRRDAALVRSLMIGLFKSTDNQSIYGIGVFFEPYQFDPSRRLFGPYVDRGNILGRDVIEFDNTDPKYDYFHLHWYADNKHAGDRVIFVRPYREDMTYISALRDIFDAHGRFVGMISVDSLPKVLVRSLRAPLVSDDVAYVTDKTGFVIMSTGPVPVRSADRNIVSQPLRWADWQLSLATDLHAVNARVQQIWIAAAAAIAGIWIAAVLIVTVLLRLRRQRMEAMGLELKQIALRNEIASHIDLQERLRQSAFSDALTGLPNRLALIEQLTLVLPIEEGDPRYAVLFIDMDRFSVINDSLGHTAGDELIRLLTPRLEGALPKSTMLARLGGDEFVALVELQHGDETQATGVAQKILTRLREPFVLKETELHVSASIGIVMIDGRYSQPEEVLRDADTAMYQAKKAGRARFALFDASMHQRVRRLLDLETDLRGALKRHEFKTFYQPIVRTSDGVMAGMEALVRWKRPGRGIANAGEFIAVAEQMGILAAIDGQILFDACRETRALSVELSRPIVASVNVSAAHLTHTDIVALIGHALSVSNLPPDWLQLEITESAIMENFDDALRALDELRAMGLRIVVDDFGTGYSSLNYLRRLPISGLKIDRSFVAPILLDHQTAAIAHAIVQLARTLDLSVTAEGVETEPQLEFLRDIGIDLAQGYYFSRAVDANEIRAYAKGTGTSSVASG